MPSPPAWGQGALREIVSRFIASGIVAQRRSVRPPFLPVDFAPDISLVRIGNMAVIAQKRSVCEVCGQQLARPGWITPQGGRVCRQCVENCEVCGQLLARPGWIKNTTGGRICLECVEKKNKTGRKNVFVDLLPFPYRLLYTSIYGIYALAMWVTLLIIQFILVIFFTPIGLWKLHNWFCDH